MDFAKTHNASSVSVLDALTYLWGCGPPGSGCAPTAALVDVTSSLAQLKFGLMEHFRANGAHVDTSLWGATAHIQTVW